MKRPNYSVAEAVECAEKLLLLGAVPQMIMIALIADGYSNAKAQTIVNWAVQKIKNNYKTEAQA